MNYWKSISQENQSADEKKYADKLKEILLDVIKEDTWGSEEMLALSSAAIEIKGHNNNKGKRIFFINQRICFHTIKNQLHQSA